MLLTLSQEGIAQTRNWPSAWTHAYVSTDGTRVYITSVGRDGFSDQKIEVETVRGLKGVDWPATLAIAKAAAVSRLGSNGFEMVGEGHAYCHFSSRNAIHFKQARD